LMQDTEEAFLDVGGMIVAGDDNAHQGLFIHDV